MPTNNAHAKWEGDLQSGKGKMELGSGAFKGAYSFKSRFEGGDDGTNPEELIGAAHAGCFSMALSNELAEAGFKPKSVETKAEVTLKMVDDEPKITTIKLITEAHIDGIEKKEFQDFAKVAKENCPVSKALTGVDIKLEANLKS